MVCHTVRFGPVHYAPGDVIHFPEGIAPFTGAHRFILVTRGDEAPFSWLQSLDDPGLTLVAAPLEELFPDEAPRVGQLIAERVRSVAPEHLVVLVLVTLDAEPERMTANLLGPVVLDPHTRQAEQVIVDAPLAMARQPIACGTEAAV